MFTSKLRRKARKSHSVKDNSLGQSVRRFVNNSRALSPVISSLVLIGVVIILGFSVLSYARSIGVNYQVQYQEDVNADIDRLKETLTFEYVYYNSSGSLKVYFMNTGSNSFEVNKVYLSTSSVGIEPTVKYFSGSMAPNKSLDAGEERLIVLSTAALESGAYTVKITTVRGSNFAYTFVV